jgi:ComF family protein
MTVGFKTNFRQALCVAEKLARLPRQLGRAALELICPSCCAVCRTEISDSKEILCGECWQQLRDNLQSRSCPVCGHNTGPYALIEGRCHRCQRRRPQVGHVVRVGEYDGVLRQLILQFKFHRQSHLDCFLGGLLASAMVGDSGLAQADLLVPIPLHWRRKWSRSYNQSELLAREAARILKSQNYPIRLAGDLVRIRHTQPQTSLATSHRLINLHNAFAVCRGIDLSGKHICLVDDVTTTGTTLRVAAHTLKKAGAARVSAAVLAVAAND